MSFLFTLNLSDPPDGSQCVVPGAGHPSSQKKVQGKGPCTLSARYFLHSGNSLSPETGPGSVTPTPPARPTPPTRPYPPSDRLGPRPLPSLHLRTDPRRTLAPSLEPQDLHSADVGPDVKEVGLVPCVGTVRIEDSDWTPGPPHCPPSPTLVLVSRHGDHTTYELGLGPRSLVDTGDLSLVNFKYRDTVPELHITGKLGDVSSITIPQTKCLLLCRVSPSP